MKFLSKCGIQNIWDKMSRDALIVQILTVMLVVHMEMVKIKETAVRLLINTALFVQENVIGDLIKIKLCYES
jgi:hypothetical protein